MTYKQFLEKVGKHKGKFRLNYSNEIRHQTECDRYGNRCCPVVFVAQHELKEAFSNLIPIGAGARLGLRRGVSSRIVGGADNVKPIPFSTQRPFEGLGPKGEILTKSGNYP